MLVDSSFDQFTTSGLIELPDLDFDTANAWTGFQFQKVPDNGLLRLAEPERAKLTQLQPHFLKLDATDVPLLDLEDNTESSTLASDDDGPNRRKKDEDTEIEEDVWTAPDLQIVRQENKLVSWDHFATSNHQEPGHRFLSEASPAVYDLLLRKLHPRSHGEQTKHIFSNVIVSSLFELGLGRDSIMFLWDEQTQRFQASLDNYALSGCSRDVLQVVVDQYMDAGTQIRRLRTFIQTQSEHSPIRIALQTAVGCVLDALQDVVETARHDAKTLVRLQHTFVKPFALLNLLDRISKDARITSNDEQLISTVLTFAEQFVSQEPQFEATVYEIICRMVQPVLRCIEAETGLSTYGESSTKYDSQVISEILSPPSAEIFDQTKNTLHILMEHNYDIPHYGDSENPSTMLRISYNLNEIVELQNEGHTYEQTTSKRISGISISRHKSSEGNVQPERTDDLSTEHDPFDFNTNMFGGYPGSGKIATVISTAGDSSLKDMVVVALTSDIEVSVDIISSCRSAVDLSITPLIRAQHRLLSYRVLQCFFRDHKIGSQMKLLGRFLLMGDGFFTSKLSLALFDSDQYSGEGNRRTHSKTGLRLQNRETWPPASSELRLALMGILAESASDIKDAQLIDTVSFTIRDLSDEDLERCRDLDSIYALDFLGLTFRPSSTITEAVVTPTSLERYDQIFNHLLRLLRMKAVVQSMLRNLNLRINKPTKNHASHSFKIEAQHFISTFTDYCTNIVVKINWLDLDQKLHNVEDQLRKDDYAGTLALVSGLDHLRDTHESMLDSIMRGLMLKRRQSEAKGIIDRLFEVILRFAAVDMKSGSSAMSGNGNPAREDDEDDNDDDAATKATKAHLHQDFRAHMRSLIQWLKVESGRAGNEGSTVYERLLLGLDWNGFWSR